MNLKRILEFLISINLSSLVILFVLFDGKNKPEEINKIIIMIIKIMKMDSIFFLAILNIFS